MNAMTPAPTAKTSTMNDSLVLIAGEAANGKSVSLRNLPDPENVVYCGTEAGKKLPFRNKFKVVNITDPFQIFEVFAQAEAHPTIHTIVIDSLTYLMDMYESAYVLAADSKDTMRAWGEYNQYFKRLMQQEVAKSSKNVIFTAHNREDLDEASGTMKTTVAIKGALKGNGVESYFSCVVYARKVAVKDLKDFLGPLLTITPQEEAIGVKYCFQTIVDKKP